MHVVLHQMLMFWLVRKMAASTDMIYEIQGKPRHLVVVLGMHVTATIDIGIPPLPPPY
jgi:hypothetical protein